MFEGDFYTHNALSPASWMSGTYSMDLNPLYSPVRNWAVWTQNTGFVGVDTPATGANLIEADTGVDVGRTIGFSRADVGGTIGVSGVRNDWFRKSREISDKHARIRSSMANPWVRGAGQAGYAHLRYDNSQIAPIYSAFSAKLFNEGKLLQAGLTNSEFLSIQIAN